MKVLTNIDTEDVTQQDDGSVTWKAKMAVDSDGTGEHHGDRTAENQTTYQPSLNADVDKYIVVPPAIIADTDGIVIGCQGHCKNTVNGMETDVVVGDVGPHKKIGEGADCTALALGLNPSPVDGGIDAHVIEYQIWPGVPAVVDGKQYVLQAHSNIK